MADVAEREGEGGVFGLRGGGARPYSLLSVEGGNKGVPARVADEVEAGEDDGKRDELVGKGRGEAAVNARGRGSGETVGGGDDGRGGG